MTLKFCNNKSIFFIALFILSISWQSLDARAKQHTVKSGETLYGISKKYNVPVDDIKRLNRLSSNSLKVGQVLTLEVESNEGGATYKVKSGDNLSSIAKKNNMTVQELKELNNLSSNSLKAGQVLTLKKAPVASSNYKTYTVKPGDNLYRIGLNNNTTEAQIIALNDLPSNVIKVGQVLKIPDAYPEPISTITPPPSTSQTTGDTQPKYHIAKKNQTLSTISQMYNIDIIDLLDYNNMKEFDIREGQRIWLVEVDPALRNETINEPESDKKPLSSIAVHIVAKGETLYRIAAIYKVNVDDLKKWNNLSSVGIKEGQRIFIGDVSGLNTELDVEFIKPSQQVIKTYSKSPMLPVTTIKITSEFGMRSGRMHKGIDFIEKVGSPIFAVLAGKVVFSGVQRGYGNVVIIEHENFQMTVYGHNDQNFVKVGDVVTQGQIIGTVGNTGNARGAHLHFEYRVRGVAINPREFLIGL